MKFSDQESRQQRVETGVDFVDEKYFAVFPHPKPGAGATKQHLGAGGFVAQVHADLFVSLACMRKCDLQEIGDRVARDLLDDWRTADHDSAWLYYHRLSFEVDAGDA